MNGEYGEFREVVWGYYREHGRHDMAWRENPSPYNVLVSEIMLQQTQVARVSVKFAEFTAAFPDIASLAAAPLAKVLALWSGLGYNRRAKFLHMAAQEVVQRFDGQIPASREDLESLPGIGRNTAGAIMAYAFERPVEYVETNIRSVYLHHFFNASLDKVDDKEILRLVGETLDHEQPREWYWALMDYGAYLKKQGQGRLSLSKQYKKQSPLKGSTREMRGVILKRLVVGPDDLHDLYDDARFNGAVAQLEAEGLVERIAPVWRLTGAGEPS